MVWSYQVKTWYSFKREATAGIKVSKKQSPQFCSEALKKAEIPSCNFIASARGLAKVAAAMTGKGTFNGRPLISEQTWTEMHSEPRLEFEAIFGMHTNFTKGGLGKFSIDNL